MFPWTVADDDFVSDMATTNVVVIKRDSNIHPLHPILAVRDAYIAVVDVVVVVVVDVVLASHSLSFVALL